MSNPSHQADDSWLGYVFQGLFALILLLDAEDEQLVSVETQDDVVLSGTKHTLYQLKHSMGQPASITVHSDALWKSLSIWIDEDGPDIAGHVLITCASISHGDSLNALRNPKTDRTSVLKDLEAEGTRVLSEIEASKLADPKKPTPYKDREKGCRKFLALTPDERMALLNTAVIHPSHFNITQIKSEVSKRLVTFLPPAQREKVAERLIEWWDLRVTQSLIGTRPRTIAKLELQTRLQEITSACSPGHLPDDFGSLEPEDYAAEITGNMLRQIELVQGGPSRSKRAARVRWQARNQRQRWIEEDISIPAMLEDFDRQLMTHWSDRHGPMREECEDSCDDTKRKRGLELLDWTHQDAYLYTKPPRPTWDGAFLVQGTYQQLAEQLDVGWHPDYLDLLNSEKDGD